ncbi:MAG: protein phosphatase 2C domain-containing protein [Archangium sp.]|nr:protein phosphatase 2C domain-containing protein [Archangium sp.]
MMRGASVIGREHVRLGRNNQDAWAVACRGATEVAVVTDGCSSGPRSEIGAAAGARWLARETLLAAEGRPLDEALASLVTRALVLWLDRLAVVLSGDRAETVEHALLFTFLCAVSRGGQVLVFGVGDGAVLCDDVVVQLDAGPDNAPDYAAYGLVGRAVSPVVHFSGDARRVAVMTDGFDGAGPRVTELVRELGANPHALQRRLNVLSGSERFHDDATVALLEAEG